MTISMTTVVNLGHDDAIEAVTIALQAEQFGVLTTIDVSATLKKKMDVDFRPYSILGACNPPLAFRALSADDEAGMLLPCNVTVEEVENGRSRITIVDPESIFSLIDSEEGMAVALLAKERLQRVIAQLEADNE